MKLLLDAHLLLWSAVGDDRLSSTARSLLLDVENKLWFSATSLWEIAIKHWSRTPTLPDEPGSAAKDLLEQGYRELALTGDHALAVLGLPKIHRGLFDRILIAQAMVEGILLLTADAAMAEYPRPIRLV